MPVSLNDLAFLLQQLTNTYDSYLFFSFTVMMAFSVAYGVRKLFLGVNS